MFKIEKKTAQATAKAGQAAIELAVFGAIIIFILGTIIRSAMGNGYTQDQNFKAMRSAMLLSWQHTETNLGKGALADTSHNSASIVVVEDRLSPDFNKYGDLDRSPYISQGSGTFTFNLLYPWQPGVDPIANLLPIMDVYINGQQFPFTIATFSTTAIQRPASCSGTLAIPPSQAQGQCLSSGGTPQSCQNVFQEQCNLNQCLRQLREWSGGWVSESQFETIISATTDATIYANADAIFNALETVGLINPLTVTGTDLTLLNVTGKTGYATPLVTSGNFISAYSTYSNALSALNLSQGQLDQIQSILQVNMAPYKLFYTREVNSTPQFTTTPPQTCSGPDNALCATLTLPDTFGGVYTNTNEDLQYDLLRLGDYNSGDPSAVETQFPPAIPPGGNMRTYIAWQWAASAATSAASIGLDASSNQYPTYDIDGRLKEVTIYAINYDPTTGIPTVSYEDMQGGDIDGTWDADSCGPKPGLQSEAQVYTFTQSGTYLQIKEGSLYNPETDLFVRSANQRDTIDLIQRTIQLSNNTGRFCSINNPGLLCGNPGDTDGVTCASPNDVEVCASGTSTTSGGTTIDNCFTSANFPLTCYDLNTNLLFVRSRLLDQRGHYWMTDTSGQLKVH